jgi:hypothetical protein
MRLFNALSLTAMMLMLNANAQTIDTKPFHNFAPTPPMGWNSWDCFGTQVTEAQTKANTDYMAEKLAKFGWQYIVVDIQWYEPGAKGHDYKEGAKLIMDEYGRLLPAENRFPSAAGGKGFKPLADYVHSKGLKFGIHMLRGVPRQAVNQKTKILNSSANASDIADKNNICRWNPDMYGIDMTKDGAQEYYDSIFQLLASWEVDFVKVDDLSAPNYQQPEVEAIRKAIDKCGRPMVLSTSPGETPLASAEHVATHANMWRMSNDFWDNWKELKDQFARCRNWTKFCGKGHFPDADMLPFGAVRAFDKGWTRFSRDEQITCMTLWCIARSPLIFGGDLPQNDAETLALITNDEVLAVNQAGENARELSNDNDLIVWVSDVPRSKDKNLAVFNARDAKSGESFDGLEVPVDLRSIGFENANIRDLWKKKSLGEFTGSFAPKILCHGAGMYRVTAP